MWRFDPAVRGQPFQRVTQTSPKGLGEFVGKVFSSESQLLAMTSGFQWPFATLILKRFKKGGTQQKSIHITSIVQIFTKYNKHLIFFCSWNGKNTFLGLLLCFSLFVVSNVLYLKPSLIDAPDYLHQALLQSSMCRSWALPNQKGNVHGNIFIGRLLDGISLIDDIYIYT